MIRENRRILNIVNGLSDILLNVAAIFLAYITRFIIFNESAFYQSYRNYLLAGIFYAFLMAFVYAMMQLYEQGRNKSYMQDVSAIFRSNIIGILVLGVALYFVRFVDFSRLTLLFSFIYSTVLVTGKHAFMRLAFRHYRALGYNKRYVLLVGAGPLAQQYAQALQDTSHLGLEMCGFIGCRPQQELAGVPRLGNIDGLEQYLTQTPPDQVVIALGEEDVSYLQKAIEACNQTGTRFSIIPFFSQYIFSAASPMVDTLGGVQLFDFCASPLDLVANKAMKRIVDVFLSFMMLVFLSPVLLLAAIGVKLSSSGPVFFRQERVGVNKDTFRMYKFRSMQVNSEESSAWSSKGDPRVTSFGRFLRKSNIDELPQLFNVLRGDMSLIGPRPEIPYHVGHFKNEIPYYMARHQIRPGITGWAQVNGFRGDTSIEERVKFDLYYIYNWSLLFDVKILFKTLFSRGE